METPNIKAQQPLIDHVHNKVGKLEQFSDRIHEAWVCLKTEKDDKRENKVCEIKLAIPGNDLFTKKSSTSFEESVSLAVEAALRQLNKWKEQRQP
ncbi:MAG: HPF/RaiA family ribosome-associated protein [Cyclobacteriaceae bacterium]